MTDSAYELLAEPIRRSLWRMGWERLRPLQEMGIRAVFSSQNDLLLAARTAAGKTEAAFLPILSQIYEHPVGSVSALYVGPLKALINDQFRRLEELCEYAEIPVHRWHGDVAAERKHRLLERPGGVLLITPESLESLFVNKTARLNQLFHSLSFIVIDELHAFLGTERGSQLRSQICRLSRYAVTPFRLIALSATIGDFAAAATWMRPDSPQSVGILRDDSDEKSVEYRIHGYLAVMAPSESASSKEVQHVPPPDFYDDIYKNFRGRKNLIFANSKAVVEGVTDWLNELGRRHGTGEEFLIHHGSVSREFREETERLMQEIRPHTTVCSSTLELGIDIGNVNAIGQIGPAWSVSSLVQRLGRSGRRDGEAQRMRVLITEDAPDSRSDLLTRLFPGLLQSVAITELMLEKWVESPDPQPLDLSTLVQQTLSCIAEMGGIPAKFLNEWLIERGEFRFLSGDQFARFLRGLAEHDLIEQRPEGDLILGLEGERIVRHYEFYAAFATHPEYRVVYEGRVVGTILRTIPPQSGDHILLAARRWQIVAVDHERYEIAVKPAAGRKLPLFPPADAEIDPRIRQKMRELLFSDSLPVYLDATAQTMFADSRREAVRAGLGCTNCIPTGPASLLWFPWTGTRAMRTIRLIFARAGVPASVTGGSEVRRLAFEIRLKPEKFRTAVGKILEELPTGEDLVGDKFNCQRRKWDHFVAPDLLRKMFIKDRLDIPLAKACFAELIAST